LVRRAHADPPIGAVGVPIPHAKIAPGPHIDGVAA
jgi:hypothetical protein